MKRLPCVVWESSFPCTWDNCKITRIPVFRDIEKGGIAFGYVGKVGLLNYKDLPAPIGRRRADFVVDKKIIVELKAVGQLEDAHLAQALNYLKAYKLEVGLLINFGSKSLTFKRLILTSNKSA